jgi:hypothetical protein
MTCPESYRNPPLKEVLFKVDWAALLEGLRDAVPQAIRDKWPDPILRTPSKVTCACCALVQAVVATRISISAADRGSQRYLPLRIKPIRNKNTIAPTTAVKR